MKSVFISMFACAALAVNPSTIASGMRSASDYVESSSEVTAMEQMRHNALVWLVEGDSGKGSGGKPQRGSKANGDECKRHQVCKSRCCTPSFNAEGKVENYDKETGMPIKTCEAFTDQKICQVFDNETMMFYAITIAGLIIIGLMVYGITAYCQKKREVIRLKFKLKKVIQLLQQYENVNPNMMTDTMINAENKVEDTPQSHIIQ